MTEQSVCAIGLRVQVDSDGVNFSAAHLRSSLSIAANRCAAKAARVQCCPLLRSSAPCTEFVSSRSNLPRQHHQHLIHPGKPCGRPPLPCQPEAFCPPKFNQLRRTSHHIDELFQQGQRPIQARRTGNLTGGLLDEPPFLLGTGRRSPGNQGFPVERSNGAASRLRSDRSRRPSRRGLSSCLPSLPDNSVAGFCTRCGGLIGG